MSAPHKDATAQAGIGAAEAWRSQMLPRLEALGFRVRPLKTQPAAHVGAVAACSLRASGDQRVWRCEWMVHFSRRVLGSLQHNEAYCQFSLSSPGQGAKLLLHANGTVHVGSGQLNADEALRIVSAYLAEPSAPLVLDDLVDSINDMLSH